MTNYPKGSDGAAEQKANKRWFTGAAAILVILASMVFVNFPHTNLHKAFLQTPLFFQVVGVIGFLVGAGSHFYFIIKQDEMEKAALKWELLGIVLPFVSIGIACSGGL